MGGRGAKSSKAGGGGAGSARTSSPAAAFNSTNEQKEAAQALYDNPKTMAFPANDRIIKSVPALNSMKEKMEDSPIGTTVVGNFGSRGTSTGGQSVRIMEKTSSTTWSVTDVVKNSDGSYTKSATSKLTKKKAMEQMQHILNDGTNSGIDDGFAKKYK